MASATVLLSLTRNEAEALVTVLCNVGGDPKTTRRKFADSVLRALLAAGVEETLEDATGNIKFRTSK